MWWENFQKIDFFALSFLVLWVCLMGADQILWPKSVMGALISPEQSSGHVMTSWASHKCQYSSSKKLLFGQNGVLGPKNAEISAYFFSHVASLRCSRVLCSGLWRHSKVFDGPGPNLRPKKYLHPKGTNGSGQPPNWVFFPCQFSSGWAFGCKYFSVGCAPQTHPNGSLLCDKTCLSLLRPPNPEILYFEAKKKAVFSPPRKQIGVIL